MTAVVITLARVFRFGGRDLADPSPEMTPEEVLSHYARQHPRLLGGKVVPPTQEKDTLVYELRAQEFGDRG